MEMAIIAGFYFVGNSTSNGNAVAAGKINAQKMLNFVVIA